MGLHDLDDCGLDGVASVVLYFTLHLSGVSILLRLGVEHGDLVTVHVALELRVHLHLVFGGERVDLRILQNDFLLDERDEVLMELISWDLGHLKELLVGDHGVFVEHQQNEHLVGRTEELVALARFEGAANLSVAQG